MQPTGAGGKFSEAMNRPPSLSATSWIVLIPLCHRLAWSRATIVTLILSPAFTFLPLRGFEVVSSFGFSLSFALWALMITALMMPPVDFAVTRTEGPKPRKTPSIASRRAAAIDSAHNFVRAGIEDREVDVGRALRTGRLRLLDEIYQPRDRAVAGLEIHGVGQEQVIGRDAG